MQTVLIFGGSGFLGSYVSDELIKRGYRIIIADIKRPRYLNNKLKFIKADILDAAKVKKIVTDNIQFVYNFAGLTDIDLSFTSPFETVNLNVLGNLNILEACRIKNIKRFIYASSAYAFSNKGSFYGVSKFASEKIIEEYATRYKLNYTIIRYGSLYGERAGEHNGIYRLLKQAIVNKNIKYKGTGEEVREYIHAKDAAKLSVDILGNKEFINEHVVLTGVERLKQKDLLIMISEILNDEIKIEFLKNKPKGHYKVTPYSFNPKIAKKLVTNPYIDMGQGLVECMRVIFEEIQSN